jgi:hypothetical protein
MTARLLGLSVNIGPDGARANDFLGYGRQNRPLATSCVR